MTRNYNSAWIPSLFNEFFSEDFPTLHSVRTSTPAINVTESDKNYKLDFAVPGITKEMTNVQLTEEGNLIVKIENKQKNEEKSEDGKRWLRREFSYGSYSQVFTLPDDVQAENITAAVTDGILSIELPKKAKEALPASRQIEVQ